VVVLAGGLGSLCSPDFLGGNLRLCFSVLMALNLGSFAWRTMLHTINITGVGGESLGVSALLETQSSALHRARHLVHF
jgi:hypothetical protein